VIEVRGFKWPRRPTDVAFAHFLGEDELGRWLGVAEGDSWFRPDDRTPGGVFVAPLVKLVPHGGTFWTACFQHVDPVVDVDIALPSSWDGDVLEEVDLELDVQRFLDGRVELRDEDELARVRARWAMPADVVASALETAAQVLYLVRTRAEPFDTVGHAWLDRFLAQVSR
jgi:hypothetical protein